MDGPQKHNEGTKLDTRVHTVQFYFYLTPKKVKLVYVIKKKTEVAQGIYEWLESFDLKGV